MSALVLDGHLKSALTVVRSLGSKQIPVCVGAERSTALALHSRYKTSSFVYPSPYTDEQGFITAVTAEAVRIGDLPVVYAFSDASFLALYRHREQLKSVCTLIFPPERAMEIAFDKAVTQSLARVSSISTIPTEMPSREDELTRTATTIRYPAVVKPRKSVTYQNGVGRFGSAQFVHSADELVRYFRALSEKIGEAPMIQERIVGEEYGVEMLARNGNPFAMVTHQRLRSLSPSGGASVLKQTLEQGALRQTLETHARRLVEDLEWTGPIMVEFKVDSDSQEVRLMEVNGRFWGSLPLSVAAGVDMPYLWYVYATRSVVPLEPVVQTDGVATRHFWGDVRNLCSVLFSRDPMRRYTYPKRTFALQEFFRIPKGTKGDVWLMQDPLPAFFEIIDIVIRIWK